jgi:hypothetical protein
MLCVTLALLATGSARDRTGLNRCANDAELGGGLPGHYAARRVTHIGAVEAAVNAANQFLQLGLAEVGVSAARTGRSALDACLDTADHRIEILANRLRMRLQHLSNRHISSFVTSHRSRACQRRAAATRSRRLARRACQWE